MGMVLDGVSEKIFNTQKVDWDHHEKDDDYHEDIFAVDVTQE